VKFSYSFVDGNGNEYPIKFNAGITNPTPLHNSWKIKLMEKNDVFLG
jgi:hypothetical protein